MNVPSHRPDVFGGFFLYNGINHFTQRKALEKHAGSTCFDARSSGGRERCALGNLRGQYSGRRKTVNGAAAIVGFLAGVSPVIDDFCSVEYSERSENAGHGRFQQELGSAWAARWH